MEQENNPPLSDPGRLSALEPRLPVVSSSLLPAPAASVPSRWGAQGTQVGEGRVLLHNHAGSQRQ